MVSGKLYSLRFDHNCRREKADAPSLHVERDVRGIRVTPRLHLVASTTVSLVTPDFIWFVQPNTRAGSPNIRASNMARSIPKPECRGKSLVGISPDCRMHRRFPRLKGLHPRHRLQPSSRANVPEVNDVQNSGDSPPNAKQSDRHIESQTRSDRRRRRCLGKLVATMWAHCRLHRLPKLKIYMYFFKLHSMTVLQHHQSHKRCEIFSTILVI